MESIIDWSQTIILLLVFILALYCTHLLRRIDEGLDCIHGTIHFIGDVFEEEIVFDDGDDDGEEILLRTRNGMKRILESIGVSEFNFYYKY